MCLPGQERLAHLRQVAKAVVDPRHPFERPRHVIEDALDDVRGGTPARAMPVAAVRLSSCKVQSWRFAAPSNARLPFEYPHGSFAA